MKHRQLGAENNKTVFSHSSGDCELPSGGQQGRVLSEDSRGDPSLPPPAYGGTSNPL